MVKKIKDALQDMNCDTNDQKFPLILFLVLYSIMAIMIIAMFISHVKEKKRVINDF